ncbi:MAG: bifunctional UDP-N-acetylglucosamine diphosphorylase/glucosamine-1-phosphate N-acetyltransferase GlmU [Acidobacteria bacterium]|nr:bifunctional UDP-N-acetylglucosamine diphosphorylase/glucosamine-1-phosphate N-acetyltransferase GlmU [Acidobacteriota bacterium]
MPERDLVAVVLAAGKSTRMISARPKVLHEVAGRPLLAWVLDAAREAGCREIVVVVGHGADEVRSAVAAADVRFAVQEEQRGTGHALAQAAAHVTGSETLLVLSGDAPLMRPATLRRLAEAAEESWGALAVAELEEPGSLGRVIVAESGHLARIVEAADATAEEIAIRTVNAGIYALPAPEIFTVLARLKTDNAKGELYLTDALGDAAALGNEVAVVALDDATEALGANDRRDLGRIHRTFITRKLEELGIAGVTVLDPLTTRVEPQVEIGADTVLHPDVSLMGVSRIGSECVLHQGAWLRDSTVADGAVIEPYCVLDGAVVGAGCSVGPFARLRPGARLEAGSKVGNYVEVKNATLGPGAKVGHLTYLGDAEIGAGANIGAGVVTCNYDGERKHRTVVGERAFVGSDTMLVAPVEIGNDATTAAGSVINRDVPDGALAIGRSKQRNVEGWAARRAKRRKQ